MRNADKQYNVQHVGVYVICSCGCGTRSPYVRGTEAQCFKQLSERGWSFAPYRCKGFMGEVQHNRRNYAPGHDAQRTPTAEEKVRAKQQQNELREWFMGER